MATAKKPKWYVVWKGATPGVYSTWNECNAQVKGFAGAVYKSFDSLAEANDAFAGALPSLRSSGKPQPLAHKTIIGVPPITPSIAVDAACDMTTGIMEYRGVEYPSGNEIFRKGPYYDCTNNIGEFLAIVHGLAWLKQTGSTLPLYSDSRTALAWLRHKHAKTTVAQTLANADVFALLNRAETWLHNNTYSNKVLKWETERWGENPADFGRK